MVKLVRVTTIPLSLEKLLEGQLSFMGNFFEVIAVSSEKERLLKYGQKNGVRIFWVNMTRQITPIQDVRAVWKLYKFLKQEKPQIVHTHTPKAGVVGMMAAKMAGVPIRLHTVAGLPLLEVRGNKRRILDIVEKTTYSLATRIYPNSRSLADIIINLGFAKQDKMKVLGEGSSNGIDTTYFNAKIENILSKPLIREKWNLPKEDLVFIFVGRLVKEKGINELVNAFDRINQKYNNTSLLLVGPLEHNLDPLEESTLRKIKLNKKIYETGYQEDVRPFFLAADVLTFPSYREGFPNVVMQAGAMELPSIVTNINGCNEIVKEGFNGFIIPVKDENALGLAMEKMLKNPHERKKMALNARSEICSKYERYKFWEVLKEEYVSLLKHTHGSL